MRQNACDELNLEEQVHAVVNVPCFLANRDAVTANNSLPSTTGFDNGQSSVDEDVNNITESEKATAVVSLPHRQDDWRRSSSKVSDEHHPTVMRDQSTQCHVNYCIPTFHSNVTCKIQILGRGWKDVLDLLHQL